MRNGLNQMKFITLDEVSPSPLDYKKQISFGDSIAAYGILSLD